MKNFIPKEYKKNRKLKINHSYLVEQFSDYTKMVTMQNLFHDGGFSYMGMSEDVMRTYMKVVNDAKKA